MFWSCKACKHMDHVGCYALSVDGVSWKLASWSAWPAYTNWTDGTSTTFVRRQKPSLIVDPLDPKRQWLLTGVDEGNGDGTHHHTGWTLMQPLKA